MDIYDIPIAEIARKYLEYVQRIQEELDLDVAGDFLITASRLLSMKARQLLPAEGEGAEEAAQAGESGSEDIADLPFRESPRDFMRQLIAYRKFKDLARQLSRRQAEQARVHYREAPLPTPPASVAYATPEPEDDDDRQNGLNDLLEAFSRVLRYVDREKPEHAVRAERYTVEDKIIHVEELLRSRGSVDVTEEFGRCFHKLEMIVTLLAILELVRLKRVRVEQDRAFGHIALALADESATLDPVEAPAAEG
jgi:segregation and condensation protein A